MVRSALLLGLLLVPGASCSECTDGTCATDELSALQRSPAALMPGINKSDSDAEGYYPVVTAKFSGFSKGTMTLTRTLPGVYFQSTGVWFYEAEIEEICGKLTGDGVPTFAYHVHTHWTQASGKTVATGAQCGSDFTGGHWDPTAACGPASGNAACAACPDQLDPYNCKPETFKWFEPNQYNSGNKYVTGNPDACELGDLSNMFGTLQAGKTRRGWLSIEDKVGLAQMSALEGGISDENKPPCKPKRPYFNRAGANLKELRERSIVIHCGSAYENPGARMVCALLS